MKLPNSVFNWISLVGATIAVFALFAILMLLGLSIIFGEGGSYLGLFTFIILPAFLVVGLLLIPLGMIRKIKKDKRKQLTKDKNWPVLDLNVSPQRNAFMIFIIGTVVFLLLTSIGSYEAFHYTESVEFCGELCHKVMEPEYVAYQNSSHARVSCVECHVGSGANWYVKSKLSGLYQVYAVLAGNYPQPIPTPISSLRPARETCEKCHWPEKFYARKHRVEKHFMADEYNSEWDISLVIKTGPQHSALGLKEGIHWHINPAVVIEYEASPDREFIPWVKYTNTETGEVQIYTLDEEIPEAYAGVKTEKRLMDCMDCHNRPSHLYNAPLKFINDKLASGAISSSIPDIKTVAMQVLNVDFPNRDSAFRYIDAEVRSYYDMMYSEDLPRLKPLIEQAIVQIKDGFYKNIFPGMKVSWLKYPNHIGHLETDGCFRCHNNKHKTKKGKVISMDCNLCHHINAQGPPSQLQKAEVFSTLEFVHPNDPDGAWKNYKCAECHKDLYR